MNYTIQLCNRNEISTIIESIHYSHNMNGVMSNYCFKLLDNDNIIGACVFGKLAMANVWRKYVDQSSDIIELRRLVCIDDTPKNTESYFIGGMLRWLVKNTTIKLIISYADETYGHKGIIYKASNFKLVGTTKPIKVIRRLIDNKLYHDKTIRTKYKGNLKPFAIRLKQDLIDGNAIYETTKHKYIYLYNLDNHR